jgi:hypothetical protein
MFGVFKRIKLFTLRICYSLHPSIKGTFQKSCAPKILSSPRHISIKDVYLLPQIPLFSLVSLCMLQCMGIIIKIYMQTTNACERALINEKLEREIRANER